ncbi:efflux transporter outer membrane subunit [Brevundimonas bullata]|jgi:NodT family efflux transporter outer membrane factor (OMF) lipoprotein|uniref:efflux transporter outer membrane subunit n=1 Tax=Brevundimonas bullata TaxID=13160 RepID=UPI003D9A6E22
MKVQIIVPALMIVALAGCATAPQRTFSAPEFAAWTTPQADDEGVVVLDWWRAFQDPALDRLVERALVRNADLRAASANLKAADALAGEARAAARPLGDASARLARTRTAGLSQPPIPGTPDRLPTQTLADVGAALSWEIDLFGGLSANIEAAQADAGEALWLRRQTEAAVAAGVVRAWLDYRSLAGLEETAQQRLAALESVEARLRVAEGQGGASSLDVTEAVAAVEAARADLPHLSAEKRNAARRLAVLTGDAPVTEAPFTGSLTIPQTLIAGSPTDMIRRRPDVAAAERRFAAAAARAGVARADLYPRISLSGSAGLTAEPDRLGDRGAFGFAFGPTLSWGVFDLDRIRARLVAADAGADAAMSRWEGTVLTALKEADDALDAWTGSRAAASAARRALVASERLSALAGAQEQAGQISRIDLSRSQADALSARLDTLQAQAQEAQAWAAAQLALGAGWRDAGLAN